MRNRQKYKSLKILLEGLLLSISPVKSCFDDIKLLFVYTILSNSLIS